MTDPTCPVSIGWLASILSLIDDMDIAGCSFEGGEKPNDILCEFAEYIGVESYDPKLRWLQIRHWLVDAAYNGVKT